jgi:preprotein translocase subunit YajC
VIIAGGIYGQIESIGEDTAILKIESGATMRVARSSILGKQEVEESGGGVF